MQSVRFGRFEANLCSGELFRDCHRIPLQRQPFQILAILLENPGELVTRDELRARLWPDGTVVDFEHSLNTAVRKLRAALGDSPQRPRFVETLTRRGYRLCIPVEPQEQSQLSPGEAPVVPIDARSRESLRALARILSAELVESPEGAIAMLVAALLVESEDAYHSAQKLLRVSPPL